MKVFWKFYFKSQLNSLKEKSIKELLYFPFLFLILAFIYLRYFLAIQSIDDIPLINVGVSELVFPFYIVFIIFALCLPFFIKPLKEKEILFFSQTQVHPYKYLSFLVVKSSFNKIWLVFLYFFFVLPFIWHHNNRFAFILLNFIIFLLIYIHYYFSVLSLRASKFIENSTGILYSILLCLIPILLWLNFDLSSKISYLFLMEFLMSCLSFGLLSRIIRLNEIDIMSRVGNMFIKQKRGLSMIKKRLKIVGREKSPIVNEFVKDGIFTLNTFFIFLIYIPLILVYIIFLYNYSQAMNQEIENVARMIFIGVFFFSQLIFASIMESRATSKNLLYNKALPVSFYNFFMMDIISFLKSVGIINFVLVIFTCIIDIKLGILIAFDIFFIPSLTWLTIFTFMDNRILGILTYGVIAVFYLFIKILLSLYFIPIALGILLYFYFKAEKRYKYLEIL